MRKRIAIDTDETIADTLARHIEWYNREFNTSLTKLDMQGRKIYDSVPIKHLEIIRNYPHNPDFFRDLTWLKVPLRLLEHWLIDMRYILRLQQLSVSSKRN